MPETGIWEDFLDLDITRYGHVSWTPASGFGTFLMGGSGDERTTTIVKPDGTQERAFMLLYDTRFY